MLHRGCSACILLPVPEEVPADSFLIEHVIQCACAQLSGSKDPSLPVTSCVILCLSGLAKQSLCIVRELATRLLVLTHSHAAAQRLVAWPTLVFTWILHWPVLLNGVTYNIANQTLRVQVALHFWTAVGDAPSSHLLVSLYESMLPAV